MRISDWSSDVCSSDLPQRPVRGRHAPARHLRLQADLLRAPAEIVGAIRLVDRDDRARPRSPRLDPDRARRSRACRSRSEERREGKECVSRCSTRWSPTDKKKNINKKKTKEK